MLFRSNGEPVDVLNDYHIMHNILRDREISQDILILAQSSDLEWSRIKKNPPRYYEIRNDVLFYVRFGPKICITKTLFDLICRAVHFSVLGFHSSPTQLIMHFKDFYHPKLKDWIREFCNSCLICLYMKNPKKRKHLEGLKTLPTKPRDSWSFDYMAGLPTVSDYKYILLFIDNFSLYCIIIPCRTRDAEELTNSFRDFICRP